MDNNLYKKIEHYVTGLYETLQDDTLVFHNINHSQSVVDRTKEIAGHYHVNEKEMLILYTSAWFHDTGYLFTEPSKHEVMSADVMKKFMLDHTNDTGLINEIENCIMATKSPRNPANLLQQIICDADTYNLGTKEFKETNKRVRKEVELKTGHVDKLEFLKGTVKLLEEHQFYTTYCKDLLSATKEVNMKKLKNKIEKWEAKKEDQKEKDKEDIPESNKLSDLEKDKTGLVSKGIQTMLRLTSQNHLKLSDMADSKANILISVNAIIISVVLGVLARKLQEETYLKIPTLIFLTSAVITIILSILATRPKISEGKFTPEDITAKKTNLLFFGNFHKASFEQYNDAMKKMMVDTDYLYGSLVKDIYYLGVILGRKYWLIRLAYNVFMIGIIVSVIAFVIAVSIHDAAPVNTIITGSGSPL
ncbi:MAG: metal-dependent phosphohydrolase sub domain protein [Chitinophagaceae bacterium]|nr:metal-dependent phosphohydrolase sub domain protein [Chitinophagaceae bacterium]MDB5223057.1 metal-dependent phosphohydrolase sub domain protein [Chitinophagaceae bacterium]